MNKKAAALLFSFLLLLAQPLTANPLYWSISHNNMEYREETPLYWAKWVPTKLQLTVGGTIPGSGEHLGLEFRSGHGLSDSTLELFGTDITAEILGSYSAYARLNLANNPHFQPYLLGGYSYHQLEREGGSVTIDGEIGGASYGGGLNFNFFDVDGGIHPYIYFEYIVHPDGEFESSPGSYELNSLNTGLMLDF